MKRFFMEKTVLKILIASLSKPLYQLFIKKNATSSKTFFSLQKAFSPFATYHFLGDALTFKMFEKLFKTLRNYYR